MSSYFRLGQDSISNASAVMSVRPKWNLSRWQLGAIYPGLILTLPAAGSNQRCRRHPKPRRSSISNGPLAGWFILRLFRRPRIMCPTKPGLVLMHKAYHVMMAQRRTSGATSPDKNCRSEPCITKQPKTPQPLRISADVCFAVDPMQTSNADIRCFVVSSKSRRTTSGRRSWPADTVGMEIIISPRDYSLRVRARARARAHKDLVRAPRCTCR
ncbi:hypothetical protein B0T26DRAFT_385712 [Lasiosphaeria miniovina]|uniref:Uncharacterized protein n=1 Tax=Lasiosphaeria miniovina TaxID=1954250 RepID=A0AA40ADZ5_9PEZI|nr:uncharacterized protein B0T26DRAFT_385712 [Lasiosphaeria miniovina]KAK0714134.1 hypothetical protein B0T26DRAFT_385712 [Lasiosphaeria miniovina]